MFGIEGFQQLETNTLVTDLVSYIEQELPFFSESKEFVDILVKKKNENQHSSAFCNFMTSRCASKYYFERETSQTGSSTIDIGVYLGTNLLYTIEAKILPTPEGTRQKPRNEHEYVYGKGAGIERFKDEKHGVDIKGKLLGECGLIAYIKKNDFQYWHKKMNQWINEASWNTSEELEIIFFNSIAKLKSIHIRKNNSSVLLHHFWVYVNKE